MKNYDFDRLFNTLRKYGRWQLMQTALLSLAWLHSGHSIIGILIIAFTPKHECETANFSLSSNKTHNDSFNKTIIYEARGSCDIVITNTNISSPCIYGFIYDEPKESSIVSEWDLVCERDFLWQTSQTMYVMGETIGSYLFTFVSDRYGRKRSYLWSSLLFVTSGVASSFVSNIYWFIALRFFNGIGQIGICVSTLILSVEMFPTEAYFYVGVWFGMAYVVGYCTTPLIGYLFKGISWRWVQLTPYALCFYIVFQIWFVDESVRWLYANGRDKEAYLILKKAARVNNVNMKEIDDCLDATYDNTTTSLVTRNDGLLFSNESNNTDILLQSRERISREDSTVDVLTVDTDIDVEKEKLSFLDILKHPKLRRHFFVSCVIWTTQYLTYYGLTFMSNDLDGNRLLNLFYGGVIDILSKLLLLFSSKWFERRCIMGVALTVCAVCMVVTAVLSSLTEQKIAITWITLVGRFAVCISFTVMWTYIPELYPTKLRSIGLGLASTASHLIGMFAPFIGYMGTYIKWGPGFFLGVMCITSSLLLKLLPETKDKPLVQTIADIDSLYAKTSKDRTQKI